MGFWENKRVLVTGGAGFIGSHVVEDLITHKAKVSVPFRNPKKVNFLEKVKGQVELTRGDLEDFDFCKAIAKDKDIVLHLAASVGGIGFNVSHHGSIFKENMRLTLNIFEASRLSRVERILLASSACVYPRFASISTREEEGFKDTPEPTNEGYGWAKRMAEFMAKSYSQEFGLKVAIARPCNVYGPRDNFDPERSHVIAALIAKALSSADPLVVWGSGEQTRSFIYVKDLAKGLLAIIEKYPQSDPLNLSSKEEIRIKDLVALILRLSGRSPKIVFDRSRPDGYPRRLYDPEKAKKILGFEAKTCLENGLKETIEWYKSNCL